MIRFLVCLLFAAAVVAANPFVETYLSEVGVHSAHQFVEIHCAPVSQVIDLTGWRVLTSSSACTLACQLQYDSFLIVDSEALAIGDIGHGSLRLNPLGDSIVLVTDSGPVADVVHYPRYPTGYDSAPLPPTAGSIAFWNYDDVEGQWMNWYVDSTPTPGEDNNDYSVISGTITGTGGVTFEEGGIAAGGQYGHSGHSLYQQTNFNVRGLGAGTYQLGAWGHYNGHVYYGVYPESVTVGYSQGVGGIDFVIPVTGVAEGPPISVPPFLRIVGRTLLLSGDVSTPVYVQLYNQVGARVSEFCLGPVKGERRIELPATLAPGVYFASCRLAGSTLKTKLVLY